MTSTMEAFATVITSALSGKRNWNGQVSSRPCSKYSEIVQATKRYQTKVKSKVAKLTRRCNLQRRQKAKELAIYFYVAFTEAELLKMGYQKEEDIISTALCKWLESDDTNDDDEETDSDRTESDRIKIPKLDKSTTEYYEEEEEEKIDDEETMFNDEDNEVTKELYEDVNVNLGNEDTEMTNA
ncbi:hypothetical protein Tco_1362220 [Tanacetum coccineum]